MDLERLRADTPGVSGRIFFDNAGASPTPDPVHQSVVEHLELERSLGPYQARREADADIEGMYRSAAELFNGHVDEIGFIENATRAWDMAFYGVRFRRGDRILTSRAEYSSNYLAFLQVEQRHDLSIEVIPDDEHGQIDLAALAEAMDDRVRLVNLCHAPTSNGLLNPAEQVGDLLKGTDTLYFLDACQSAGQVPLDMEKIACDVMTTTGRKFLRGPRGTGLLFVRRDRLEEFDPPFIDIHSAEWTGRDEFVLRPDVRRFENWESNVAGRVGLKAALDYCLELDVRLIRKRVDKLAGTLRNRLQEIDRLQLLDRGLNQTGIVTFTVPGVPAETIRETLSRLGTSVSSQGVADARLDIENVAPDLVRASVHYFNTAQEIERFCGQMKDIVSELT